MDTKIVIKTLPGGDIQDIIYFCFTDNKMARKIPEGEFRNKERTKLKLINAVGEIIRSEGYTKLGVNRIAGTAGVSKKLIYRYFGSVDQLIETYVKGKDYWIAFRETIGEQSTQHADDHRERFMATILKNLYTHLSVSPEAQKIILWEISEKSRLMREICGDREALGSELFSLIDPLFEKTDVDIRAILALLLGGIYYTILHANATGGPFCEIGTASEEKQARLFKSIDAILKWTYAEAAKQQKEKA